MRAAAFWSILLIAAAAVPLRAAGLSPIDEAAYKQLIAGNKGQVVLADFWATWCIPCRAEMPQLVKLEARLRAKGLKLVTISCDEPEQEGGAAEFLQKNGVAAPHYIKRAKSDENFINSVDPKWSGALPGLFVYDRQGRLVKSFIGETDMADLEAVLKKVL